MSMLRLSIYMLFASVFLIGEARATTWDEPWHREVVSAATSFGLYEIDKSGSTAVTLKRIKHIVGDDPGPVVELNAFYALQYSSLSDEHGPVFRLPVGKQAYFHLKRVDSAWAIATPTAGFAGLGTDGKVLATYRISVHQALLEAGLFEATQRCIFLVLHGQNACEAPIAEFIQSELAKPVEVIGGDSNMSTLGGFFRQHVALETAGLIGYGLSDETLERFLCAPDMHVQLSALRALVATGRANRAERLMRFVEDQKGKLTARIFAAGLLQEIGAHEMKQRLLRYAASASEEEVGLGIELMDPRIGTSFPSTLKRAVKGAGEAL